MAHCRNVHFGRPDQNTYTPTPAPNRQISSSHVVPLPIPVSSGRDYVEPSEAPLGTGMTDLDERTGGTRRPFG